MNGGEQRVAREESEWRTFCREGVGIPPCWRGKSLQGDERKEDKRIPVEPRRERWPTNVLKRKGIEIAVEVSRDN
jgi:hypothetical protein